MQTAALRPEVGEQWYPPFREYLQSIGVWPGHQHPDAPGSIPEDRFGTFREMPSLFVQMRRIQNAWNRCPVVPGIQIILDVAERAAEDIDLQLELFSPLLRDAVSGCGSRHILLPVHWFYRNVFPTRQRNGRMNGHYTVLHVDTVQRETIFMDPNTVLMRGAGGLITKIMEQRCLLPGYRTRVVHWEHDEDCLQEAWEPRTSNRTTDVCPGGYCSTVSLLVIACCYRFGWYDLDAVARVLRFLARSLSDAEHVELRRNLAHWQMQLGDATRKEADLRESALYGRTTYCGHITQQGTPCRLPHTDASHLCAEHEQETFASRYEKIPQLYTEEMVWPTVGRLMRAFRGVHSTALGLAHLVAQMHHFPQSWADLTWLAVLVGGPTRMSHPVEETSPAPWLRRLLTEGARLQFHGVWLDLPSYTSEWLPKALAAIEVPAPTGTYVISCQDQVRSLVVNNHWPTFCQIVNPWYPRPAEGWFYPEAFQWLCVLDVSLDVLVDARATFGVIENLIVSGILQGTLLRCQVALTLPAEMPDDDRVQYTQLKRVWDVFLEWNGRLPQKADRFNISLRRTERKNPIYVVETGWYNHMLTISFFVDCVHKNQSWPDADAYQYD